MFFLINTLDNSVNCQSEHDIPDWMMVSYPTYKVEIPDDKIPKDVDLSVYFYDKENECLIPHELGLKRMAENELQEYIDQQQVINQAIASQDSEKYNKLVEFLAKVFPNNPDIEAILSDNTVTQDELQQIENMLNNQ
jgi:hypothetical protein